MKIELSILAAAVAVLLLAFQMPRAIGAEGLKPEQQRMKACNTQAKQKNLEGAERNHFMRACLKGKNGNGPTVSVHQKRTEDCTRQARERRLEGSKRRGFMSECEKPPVKQEVAEKEKMKGCEQRAKDRRLDADEKRKYIEGCANGAGAAGS
jgi:psiF repeat-containing protein